MEPQNTYTPFADESFNLNFTAFALSEILKLGIGFDSRSCTFMPPEIVDGVEVPEATDNPFLVDADGRSQFYQRDLVWSLEDKVSLIDAIYNYSDIGKFVVVRRGYDYIRKMVKTPGVGRVAFHELVDGKQRLNAIAEFMQDGYRDSAGHLYSEIDPIHKRRFMSYNKCVIAILEHATPQQIKRAFLNVNHTGKPMSREHIEFIKSINV